MCIVGGWVGVCVYDTHIKRLTSMPYLFIHEYDVDDDDDENVNIQINAYYIPGTGPQTRGIISNMDEHDGSSKHN